VRCGDGYRACRNANGLAATDKVDFATLGYGLLRRGGVCTRGSMFINSFDVDGARKEGTALYSVSLEPIMTIIDKDPPKQALKFTAGRKHDAFKTSQSGGPRKL